MSDFPPISPDVVHRRVGDEVVLVNLATNKVIALNPTAARFWELLVEGAGREAVERLLLAEFDVPAEQLRAEIDDVVGRLVAVGALNA